MGLKNRVSLWRRQRQRRQLDLAILRLEAQVKIARRRLSKGKKVLAALHAQKGALNRE